MILLLGDLHIGKGTNIGKIGVGSHLNSRIEDQLNLLDWTLDQAIDKSANHIIVTGDIFEDTKPLPSLITFFIAWLKKCQINNVYVHLIMGNHDILRNGFVYSSPLDIISEIELDNVSVYKNISTIIIDTTAFTLMPFRDRKSFGSASNTDALNIVKNNLFYELASIPATYKKVIIGHFAIDGSIPVGDEIDDISNELFCPLDMFNGYDLVFMGHVHKPQVMKKKNPYIAHIGSMDISNFGEIDHKKHIVILDPSSKNNEFLTEILPTRPLKKLSISIPKDVADTTEYSINFIKNMKNNWNKSTVKVDISLEAPELQSVNKVIIEKYLIDQGAFSIASISESKKIILIKKDNVNILNNNMDVSFAIKKYSESYIEDDCRDGFIDLALNIYKKYRSEMK